MVSDQSFSFEPSDLHFDAVPLMAPAYFSSAAIGSLVQVFAIVMVLSVGQVQYTGYFVT